MVVYQRLRCGSGTAGRVVGAVACATLLIFGSSARAVTLSVSLLNAPQEVTTAWNNYLAPAIDPLLLNGGATQGAPGVISFRNADMEGSARGIFDAASVGPNNGPGRVIFNAEARARNYGGRSGELILTDLTFSSSVPDLVTYRVTIQEDFPVDANWLANLPVGSEFGWVSGLSGKITVNDAGQTATIASVTGINGSVVRGDVPVPLFGFTYTQLAPLAAGPLVVPFADAPAVNPLTGDPPGVATFSVRYVIDLSLVGGAPNNEVKIRLEDSLDGLGVGHGFGDRNTPLIPEPTALACLSIAILAGASVHRRR